MSVMKTLIANVNFGQAIMLAKEEYRITRSGWNGRGMWVALMPALYMENDKLNDRTKRYLGVKT